jgi:hypothetical protein
MEHRSEALPLPSTKAVGEAIGASRILIIEPINETEIIASAAVFQMTPHNARTYVGELAGMRATGRVGGLQPITAQTLLLALRILGHAGSESVTLLPGVTTSLVAIVKSDNCRSIRNLENARMKRLELRPDWIKFDETGWHGRVVVDEWNYYYADNDTVRGLLETLGPGLLESRLVLNRINRITNQLEDLVFYLELNDIRHSAEDLRRIMTGDWAVDLGPPPPIITF